jgi:hypothetical protein
MKHFSPKILLLLLVLPLVLAACGGGKADNAKSFAEDLFAGDASKAKENACDALHPSIDLIAGLIEEGDESVELENLECEEDGDTNVKCTAEVDGESDSFVLVMDDDDKVCGGDIFDDVAVPDVEIPDVEIPDVEIPDVEVPDTDADTSE